MVLDVGRLKPPTNHWLINVAVSAWPSCGKQILPSTGDAAKIQPAAGPATDMSALRSFFFLPALGKQHQTYILQNVTKACAGNRSETNDAFTLNMQIYHVRDNVVP